MPTFLYKNKKNNRSYENLKKNDKTFSDAKDHISFKWRYLHFHDADIQGRRELTKKKFTHFINAVDQDLDSIISKDDLLEWAKQQRTRFVGGLNVEFLHEEIDIFFSQATSKRPPKLNELDFRNCINNFYPKLAFDWNDPLQDSIDSTIFKENIVNQISTIFSRMDTDNDGKIHPHDIRIWRKLVYFGRAEDILIYMLIEEVCEESIHYDELTDIDRDKLYVNFDQFLIILLKDYLLFSELYLQSLLIGLIFKNEKEILNFNNSSSSSANQSLSKSPMVRARMSLGFSPKFSPFRFSTTPSTTPSTIPQLNRSTMIPDMVPLPSTIPKKRGSIKGGTSTNQQGQGEEREEDDESFELSDSNIHPEYLLFSFISKLKLLRIGMYMYPLELRKRRSSGLKSKQLSNSNSISNSIDSNQNQNQNQKNKKNNNHFSFSSMGSMDFTISMSHSTSQNNHNNNHIGFSGQDIKKYSSFLNGKHEEEEEDAYDQNIENHNQSFMIRSKNASTVTLFTLHDIKDSYALIYSHQYFPQDIIHRDQAAKMFRTCDVTSKGFILVDDIANFLAIKCSIMTISRDDLALLFYDAQVLIKTKKQATQRDDALLYASDETKIKGESLIEFLNRPGYEAIANYLLKLIHVFAPSHQDDNENENENENGKENGNEKDEEGEGELSSLSELKDNFLLPDEMFTCADNHKIGFIKAKDIENWLKDSLHVSDQILLNIKSEIISLFSPTLPYFRIKKNKYNQAQDPHEQQQNNIKNMKKEENEPFSYHTYISSINSDDKNNDNITTTTTIDQEEHHRSSSISFFSLSKLSSSSSSFDNAHHHPPPKTSHESTKVNHSASSSGSSFDSSMARALKNSTTSTSSTSTSTSPTTEEENNQLKTFNLISQRRYTQEINLLQQSKPNNNDGYWLNKQYFEKACKRRPYVILMISILYHYHKLMEQCHSVLELDNQALRIIIQTSKEQEEVKKKKDENEEEEEKDENDSNASQGKKQTVDDNDIWTSANTALKKTNEFIQINRYVGAPFSEQERLHQIEEKLRLLNHKDNNNNNNSIVFNEKSVPLYRKLLALRSLSLNRTLLALEFEMTLKIYFLKKEEKHIYHIEYKNMIENNNMLRQQNKNYSSSSSTSSMKDKAVIKANQLSSNDLSSLTSVDSLKKHSSKRGTAL